jgi:hypothetical protein
MKAQQLLPGPDIIGQASSHGWDDELPLSEQSVAIGGATAVTMRSRYAVYYHPL